MWKYFRPMLVKNIYCCTDFRISGVLKTGINILGITERRAQSTFKLPQLEKILIKTFPGYW